MTFSETVQNPTLETRVADWTQTYADTITENYRQYHIRTLEGNLHGNYPEYARQQLDAIENGTANLMWFKVYSGKRYKIVQQQLKLGKVQSIMDNIVMQVFTHLLTRKLVKFSNLRVGQTCKACQI